jgi:polysaccharide export outer membrane protein
MKRIQTGVDMKNPHKNAARLSIVLLVLLVFVGQSESYGLLKKKGNKSADTQATNGPTAGQQAHNDSYLIGNDDVLAINVWKEKEMSRSIPVRSDGKISLPLVGEVQAAGQTPLQLEHAIEQKLQAYISDPEVTVMVEQINSKKFNILGQVLKPGSYSLSLAGTVVDAIAAAGGFRDFAKKNKVYVLRKGADGKQVRIPFSYKNFIKGKSNSGDIELQPNDTIIVP